MRHPRRHILCLRGGVKIRLSRFVIATRETCKHSADVNVDPLPETIPVPEVGRRPKCSACGGRRNNTRPGGQAGETLHGLEKRYDLSRNLIRVWVERYQAGAFDEDAAAADLLAAYEARRAARIL